MKIRIDGGALNAAASWAAKIAPTSHAHPLLGGVLLTAGEHLALSATDLEVFGTVEVSTDAVFDTGQALVSGRLLAAVTKLLGRDDDATLIVDGTVLTVTRGRARWSLPLMAAHDYPAAPDVGDTLGHIPAGTLRDTLTRVLPAAATEPALPELASIEITTGGHLTFAATDRYQLAVATIPWTPSSATERAMVIPAAFARAAVAALNGGDVTLTAGDNLAGITTDHHTLTARLIAAQYPPWRGLVPAPGAANTRVTIDTAALANTVRGVAVFAEPYEPLRLTLTPTSVRVQLPGNDSPDDRADDELAPASFDGDPATIHLNPHYLADALSSITTPHVAMSFVTAPTQRVLIQPVGDDSEPLAGYQHVIVPIRTNVT